MKPPRIVFIHGAATTASTWDAVLRELGDLDTIAVQRPYSGSIDGEIEALASECEGAFVVGVSGGATLTLALAASDVHLVGGLAHEPAAGSLMPDLLAPMVEAWSQGGLAAFGPALYGPQWSLDMAPSEEAAERDFAMFRAFEPAPPRMGQGHIDTSVGELSPVVRHVVAARLHSTLGYQEITLPGAKHFVQQENPAAFAALVRRLHAGLSEKIRY